MKYFLKKNGNSRTLHIEPPKKYLADSKFILIIKDLTGKLLLLLEEISLPEEIHLDNLIPGKYILILKNEKLFFSELLIA